MSETRTSNRKTRVGMVTSDKMDKTAIITITHRFRHPMYGKSSATPGSSRRTTRRMPAVSGIPCGLWRPGRFPATSAGAWLRSSKKRSKTLPWARRAMAQA